MKIRSDYPRQKKQEEIENITTDPSQPRPIFWDQSDSEDRAIGYHDEEGLQYITGNCEEEENCDGSCPHHAPIPDMNPFEDLEGYYPESGKYHENYSSVEAAKKAEDKEFPFPLKELAGRHEKLEKVPFQVKLGGKILEIVVGDGEDLYLVYELQQQVVFSVRGLKQAPLLSRILALLVELWPTSVFETDDVGKLRSEVMADFIDWYLEFGEITPEVSNTAAAFKKTLMG